MNRYLLKYISIVSWDLIGFIKDNLDDFVF
jgi:hypothetical protein